MTAIYRTFRARSSSGLTKTCVDEDHDRHQDGRDEKPREAEELADHHDAYCDHRGIDFFAVPSPVARSGYFNLLDSHVNGERQPALPAGSSPGRTTPEDGACDRADARKSPPAALMAKR